MTRRFARTVDLDKLFSEPAFGVGAEGEATTFSTGAVVVALLGGVAVGSVAMYLYRQSEIDSLGFQARRYPNIADEEGPEFFGPMPERLGPERFATDRTQAGIERMMAERDTREPSRIERQYALQMQRPEILYAIREAQAKTRLQQMGYEPAPITERDDGPAPAPEGY